MVGVTPQTSANPYTMRRHAEQLALTDGALKNLQAGTAAYGAAQTEQMKAQADLAKTMLSNADDLSTVFGGMQVGQGLENYINLPSLQGLQPTGLTGEMTQQLEGLMKAGMLAKIGAMNRGGRGGGGSATSTKPIKAEGVLLTDGEGNWRLADHRDAIYDVGAGWSIGDWASLPDDSIVTIDKVGQAATGAELKRRNIIGGDALTAGNPLADKTDEELRAIAGDG